MYQPIIRDLQFKSQATTFGPINGCALEPGSLDPFYTNQGDYTGSSATFLSCSISNFSGFGVYSQSDRQRFYCEYLRCLSNEGGGIRILGNDPVIGPRSGFGSNGKTQVQVVGCSGLIMTAVNVFDGTNRSAGCIALDLQNVNGATVTGCIFNDTINIDGGGSSSNKDTSIVIAGCDFNPNDSVFVSSGNPKGTGAANDDYNAFIRVGNMVNVNISGNSFCAAGTNKTPPDPKTFKYLLAAVNSSQVVFTGSVRSTDSTKNYFTRPVYTDTGISGSTSAVTFALRDLYSGASASGSIGKSGAARFPDMRGIDPFALGDAIYAGYAVADAGPILQNYGPEFTAEAIAIITATASSNNLVPASARIAIIDVTSILNNGTITVQMPYTNNYKHIKVVFRGFANRLVNLLWKGSNSAGVATTFNQVLRDVPVPSKTVLRSEVELFSQPGGVWFMVTEQPVLFIAQCKPEGTVVSTQPGANQVVYTFTAPTSFVITEVRCWLATARVSGDPTLAIDVQITGAATTIFSTQPLFADGSVSTGDGLSTAGVLVSPLPFLANEDKIQILVNVTGSGSTSAKGLKVLFRGFATGGL
jgi:hypothetical protein